MTPLDFVLLLALVAVGAGVLGSLIGLGGGIVVVPVLTLVFHLDIRLAIGASIVSVIATSSGAAASYVRDRLANVRAGMFLELATVAGALSGAFLTTLLPARALFLAFAAVLGYCAVVSFGRRRGTPALAVSDDRIADYLGLHGSYFDPALGREIDYKVTGSRLGLGLMYVAGVVSAVLGIGSGALKVPAMDLVMHLPIKVSTATSNFMIGVTAAASAGVYLARGEIDPIVAGPVAVGVLAGSMVGARLLGRVSSGVVRIAFIVAVAVVCAEMLLRGIGG